MGTALPRKPVGRFLVSAGVVLVGVWLSGLVPALIAGTAPDVIGHYTTIVTYPLDLGIIAPACVTVGAWVLRGRPHGTLFAAPLLALCSLIGIVVIAQTVFQVGAGVELTAAEIAIYVVSFLLMASVSGWLLRAFVRSIPAAASRASSPVSVRSFR